MLELKLVPAIAPFKALLLLVAFCTVSCAKKNDAERQVVDMSRLYANGSAFNGQEISLSGCIKANHHGLLMSACPGGEQKIAILFSESMGKADVLQLRTQAVRSEAQNKKLLVATLCGTYQQTPDAIDRWIEVDAVVIGKNHYGRGAACEGPTS
jgi:hypothetical protein